MTRPIPNAEDGVAGLTQDAVAPGQSMTYEFVAREAGTYWYHSHQQTEAQLPRGLFGAIVVEPAQPAQQRDVTIVLHGSSGSQVSINGEKTWDVAFVADNPGIWMFHCHVLLHTGMGMVTTINYAGISTSVRDGLSLGQHARVGLPAVCHDVCDAD